jgi:hypothetical protein
MGEEGKRGEMDWNRPDRNRESKPIVETVLFGGNRVSSEKIPTTDVAVSYDNNRRSALYVLVLKEPGSQPDIDYR